MLPPDPAFCVHVVHNAKRVVYGNYPAIDVVNQFDGVKPDNVEDTTVPKEKEASDAELLQSLAGCLNTNDAPIDLATAKSDEKEAYNAGTVIVGHDGRNTDHPIATFVESLWKTESVLFVTSDLFLIAAAIDVANRADTPAQRKHVIFVYLFNEEASTNVNADKQMNLQILQDVYRLCQLAEEPECPWGFAIVPGKTEEPRTDSPMNLFFDHSMRPKRIGEGEGYNDFIAAWGRGTKSYKAVKPSTAGDGLEFAEDQMISDVTMMGTTECIGFCNGRKGRFPRTCIDEAASFDSIALVDVVRNVEQVLEWSGTLKGDAKVLQGVVKDGMSSYDRIQTC